jgi:hypothetical protein
LLKSRRRGWWQVDILVVLPIPFHLKRNFWSVFFSSLIIKIPKSLKRRSIEKEREKVLKEREREKEKGKERKRKIVRVSSNKKEMSIFWEEKNVATSKSFLYEPIFSLSIIPFQKPFLKSFEKILQLFLDHPLTWQYT